MKSNNNNNETNRRQWTRIKSTKTNEKDPIAEKSNSRWKFQCLKFPSARSIVAAILYNSTGDISAALVSAKHKSRCVVIAANYEILAQVVFFLFFHSAFCASLDGNGSIGSGSTAIGATDVVAVMTFFLYASQFTLCE